MRFGDLTPAQQKDINAMAALNCIFDDKSNIIYTPGSEEDAQLAYDTDWVQSYPGSLIFYVGFAKFPTEDAKFPWDGREEDER
jgi:hypothetical protein